jgi:hypothetical protein
MAKGLLPVKQKKSLKRSGKDGGQGDRHPPDKSMAACFKINFLRIHPFEVF